jgi:hypothetical protein
MNGASLHAAQRIAVTSAASLRSALQRGQRQSRRTSSFTRNPGPRTLTSWSDRRF